MKIIDNRKKKNGKYLQFELLHISTKPHPKLFIQAKISIQ